MALPLDRPKVIRIYQQNKVSGLVTPPSLIEDFYVDEAAFSALKGLSFVYFLGAALDPTIP
jgi:hypothetical protein